MIPKTGSAAGTRHHPVWLSSWKQIVQQEPEKLSSHDRFARGLTPRLSAPITEVVMPEECQSIPMTEPRA